MDLPTALKHLDPDRDSDWTTDGLPRLDAVRALMGSDSVTRKDVTDIAPGLTRETFGAPAEVSDDEREGPTLPTDDEVLAMPLHEVVADYALTVRAQEAINHKHAAAVKQRAALDEEITRLSAHGAMLDRAINLHKRRDPSLGQTNPVQDYLRASREARAKRANRARAFIEAGTTAKDVQEELRSTSKIDQAFSQRKPNRGSARPSRSLKT